MINCPHCHRSLYRPKPKKCEVCAKTFKPVRTTGKYCCDSCKTTAYRRRKRQLQRVAAQLGA